MSRISQDLVYNHMKSHYQRISSAKGTFVTQYLGVVSIVYIHTCSGMYFPSVVPYITIYSRLKPGVSEAWGIGTAIAA